MNVREVSCSDIQNIISEPWVDKTRRPYVVNDTAFIPVVDGYPYTNSLPERRRKKRGYQKIGDIIAFHGTKPDQELVDEVIKKHAPRAVIWYRGHQGEMRIPDYKTLYGITGEVIHKETGISYRLDPARVMFSQGNREEKIRISQLVHPGEYVCDMFAGIGYFTLPLARAGAIVHAIELNPDSVEYLRINCINNHLDSRVTISHGDCRNNMQGFYDRIHMGYYDAIDFLSCALEHAKSGTVLHVHGIGDIRTKIDQIMTDHNVKAGYNHRVVKKIGPGKIHTVTDVVVI